MKCIWKLAYQVLETWVPYLIWVLETHFPLVDLDIFLPHRSRVFYTQFQYTLRTELNTQKRRKPREERRKKETQQKERKKKKIHSKEEDPRHTQTQSPSSTSRSSIYGAVHDLHGCSLKPEVDQVCFVLNHQKLFELLKYRQL